MLTLTYTGKSFTVVYRPFPNSDVTATRQMLGSDAEDVRKHFERMWTGDIVSITED
jgi:hypothetical protein